MAAVEPCVQLGSSRPPTFPVPTASRPVTKQSTMPMGHSRPPTVPSIALQDDACEDVEDKFKSMAVTKRIRVSEFFKDYDPLRSGYITSESYMYYVDRFLRVLLTRG